MIAASCANDPVDRLFPLVVVPVRSTWAPCEGVRGWPRSSTRAIHLFFNRYETRLQEQGQTRIFSANGRGAPGNVDCTGPTQSPSICILALASPSDDRHRAAGALRQRSAQSHHARQACTDACHCVVSGNDGAIHVHRDGSSRRNTFAVDAQAHTKRSASGAACTQRGFQATAIDGHPQSVLPRKNGPEPVFLLTSNVLTCSPAKPRC